MNFFRWISIKTHHVFCSPYPSTCFQKCGTGKRLLFSKRHFCTFANHDSLPFYHHHKANLASNGHSTEDINNRPEKNAFHANALHAISSRVFPTIHKHGLPNVRYQNRAVSLVNEALHTVPGLINNKEKKTPRLANQEVTNAITSFLCRVQR